MILLYMDENVHGAVTNGLRRRGIDLLTVQEDGRGGEDDPDVLDRAGALGRVLFSQDEDLLTEAVRRLRSGQSFAGVIYAHQSLSIGRCVTDLEFLAAAGEAHDFHDQVYYLPLD
jgi:hypothetical protein